MTTIYLYGHLGRHFGHRWKLDVKSPAEAVRAIIANRPDFQKYMIEHSQPGYRVFIGPDLVKDETGLGNPVGRQAIKIVPVVAGAAKSPIIGLIIGLVIVAVAVVSFQYELLPLYAAGGGLSFLGTGMMSAGFIGAGLAISGVSALLAGTPRAPDFGLSERPQNRPSFMFNGPVNTTAQGHPVPVGYGTLRVGSAVVSAAIVSETVTVAAQ